MSVPTPFQPPFQPGVKVSSNRPSDPVPTPVPSTPLIPPGVGTPALEGRGPHSHPPAVAVEPRIETAPNGEQTLIYQTRDEGIKAHQPFLPSAVTNVGDARLTQSLAVDVLRTSNLHSRTRTALACL